MFELKLGLEHEVVAVVRNDQDDLFAAVYIERDNAYCTYAVAQDRTCYWGHYMLATPTDAVADLSKRSGVSMEKLQGDKLIATIEIHMEKREAV